MNKPRKAKEELIIYIRMLVQEELKKYEQENDFEKNEEL